MTVRILTGDCRDVLRSLPDESVHCCVTSPPYFGLRDYGVAGQIGLEPTPDEYVAALMGIFRQVRRVLRSDGTLWLNLGDSYAGYHGNKNAEMPTSATNGWTNGTNENARTSTANRNGLKQKDLIGIPWRVAFALQQPYYAGKIKEAGDRVWLAAVIDGEGCFFIHKRKAGTSAYSKFVRADGTEVSYDRTADTYGVGLEISNTSKRLIDRVAEIVPNGTFTTQGPEQNERRKQTIYRWRISPNETKRLAQELYPHLVAKQHQARLIFSCPSNGDAGAAAHQAMMDLHNGSSTSVDFAQPPSLYEQGYYLRQDIIWGKPNPMPESVTDRCTKAHEYLFLLSKSERYYYDADAIAEELAESTVRIHSSANVRPQGTGADWKQYNVGNGHSGLVNGNLRDGKRNKRSVWEVATQPFSAARLARAVGGDSGRKVSPNCPLHGDQSTRVSTVQHDERLGVSPSDRSRNTDSHLAQGLFDALAPTETRRAERCAPDNSDLPAPPCSLLATDHSTQTHRRGHAPEILQHESDDASSRHHTDDNESRPGSDAMSAHTPESKSGEDCELNGMPIDRAAQNGTDIARMCTCEEDSTLTDHFAVFPPALIEPCILAGCPKGGTVLDPFGGAGTTGLVADRLQRDAILIELNPEYAAMAERRIRNEGGFLCDVQTEPSPLAVAAELSR